MNLLELLRQIAANSAHAAGSPERIAELRAAIDAYRTENPDDTVDLAVLDTAAMEAFEAARAGELNAATLADMQGLADVCDAVREVGAADQAAADEIAQQAAALASRVAGSTDDPAAVDLPADPPPPADPPADPPPADPDPAGAVDTDPALVASGRQPRVPLGRLPNHRRRDPQRPAGRVYNWRAAADIRGVSAGADILDVDALVQAVQTRLHAFGRAGGSGTQQAGIAMIHRENKYGAQFALGNREITEAVLEALTDETRLPGGSLVAAGGWCVPSEILYDLLPGADANAGMVDIPGMTVRRGGIRWPATPSFATLYASASTSFYQTEATVIAGETPKPCFEIPCTTFSEERLGVAGVCIRSPILTERGYPELVRAVTAEVLAVHAHKVNQRKIADMVTDSTANTITQAQMTTAGYTASLLTAIELQVEYLRYRHRWAPTTTMVIVLPIWARGTVRADLASRNGQPIETVTDAQIAAFMAARGAVVNWVYDWQDSFATGVAGDFGGTTPPKNFPATVSAMIFRAGTFFVAEQDVITIDGLYDSALLEDNMHLALFTEEGFAVGKRDWPSILLNVPVCPGGMTGGQIDVCDLTAGTEDSPT